MTAESRSGIAGRLEGEVALVTGGAQGIGLSTAARLASEGAVVVIADVEEQRARAAAAELEASGLRVTAVGCDVRDRLAVRSAVARTADRYGLLSVLVNNAGIIRVAPFLDMTDETWSDVLAVNLNGMFIVGQEAARVMAAQRSGRIINMASVSARIAHAGQAAYAAAKAGIEAMTRVMAVELAPVGIAVNAVAPGTISTNFLAGALPPEAQAERIRRIPLASFGLPADVAGVVAFLASRDAAYVTGSVITVDGGLTVAGIRSDERK